MLLRHAKSDWPGGVSDAERPLARRGLQAAPLMGAWMRAEGLKPDLALVSPALRTQQTWALVGPELGGAVPSRTVPRIYEAYPEHLLEMARGAPAEVRTLLIVGHNPGLEELASELTGFADPETLARMRRKFPTCALAVIDFDGEDWATIAEGEGRLERFATPASIGHGPDE